MNRFFDNSKVDSAYSHAGSKKSIGQNNLTRGGTNNSPSQMKPQIQVGQSPRQPMTEHRAIKRLGVPTQSMTPATHKTTLQQFEDMKRKYEKSPGVHINRELYEFTPKRMQLPRTSTQGQAHRKTKAARPITQGRIRPSNLTDKESTGGALANDTYNQVTEFTHDRDMT